MTAPVGAAGSFTGRIPDPAVQRATISQMVILNVGLRVVAFAAAPDKDGALAASFISASTSFAGFPSARSRRQPLASGRRRQAAAAALAATSVGVTARVFSDLRALGTVEARTVLGAAVVDDVLGLVILTVVVLAVSTDDAGLRAAVTAFAGVI